MRIVKYIKNPFLLVKSQKMKWLHGKYGQKIDDETYLKKVYKLKMGKELNLENPQTFNEKLQWLKLYDRKPEYTQMVDKYEAKKYVANEIGEEYIIKTLGVWEKFDDINFDKLPNQFVLKTTHDSGGVIICRDRKSFNIEKAKEKLEESLKRNYFYAWREWPYKNVKPRIIVEEYVQDRMHSVLPVYKIFNFNNGSCILQAIQDDKTKDERIDYFDENWNLLNLRQNYKTSDKPLEKPETFSKMLEFAKHLSKGFSFLRTDFYEVNGKLYFSEFTFYSDAGLAKFEPEEWDYKLGSWINLPKIEKNDI